MVKTACRLSAWPQLVGASPIMMELSEEVARVARSDAKVLVTGESGVGKELIAQSIHTHSGRAQRPFVAVNCAGIPETLLESELFGHERGSFTGAYRDKPGKFEVADRGTLFLDEIGEMTLRMQGLLLRFLETGEIQKVGADNVIGRVDVRIVSSTNRNLREMTSLGTFREDLFYRLNVIHLEVPPQGAACSTGKLHQSGKQRLSGILNSGSSHGFRLLLHQGRHASWGFGRSGRRPCAPPQTTRSGSIVKMNMPGMSS
jgi:transcriptional regulator with PAS, ATPase and Fis domain